MKNKSKVVSPLLSQWYPNESTSKRCGDILQPIPNAGYSRLCIHQLMLEDSVRTSLFNQAIQKTVRKGDAVLDLGTGTGILSFFSCQAGAGHVYAIEREQIIGLAKKIAEMNGFKDSIEFINQTSENIKISSHIDVLISECFGHAGVGTTQIKSVLDAKTRFLSPQGKIIPQKLEVHLALIESSRLKRALHRWDHIGGDLDFKIATKLAVNQIYTAVIDPSYLLSEPRSVYTLDFCTAKDYDGFDASLEFDIKNAGILHGLGLWFSSVLCDGVVLHTGPFNPMTHWYQNFLPCDPCLKVKKNDKIIISIRHAYEKECSFWQWGIIQRDSKSKVLNSVEHDTRYSYPLAIEFHGYIGSDKVY